MKILQVTAVDFTIKKFLLPLIEAAKSEGYIIEIACNSGEFSADLREQGYIVHHIPFSRNINIISHLLNFFRLVKLLSKEKYDIVHVHTPMASLILRVAAKVVKVPSVIYTAHGFFFHENMKPIVYKFAYYIEKLWGRFFSDYIFFQSKEDYDLAVSKRFKLPSRLLHIGNGVSSERFDPSSYQRDEIRKDLGLTSSDLVFIFVGRFVREKGIYELLEAFKKVASTGRTVKLLLVGGSVKGDRGSISKEDILESIPKSMHKAVHVLGLRNDIPQLLSAADIFLLPSYREGLPRSIIEAMAMGKPIIATDIRGCREEVESGHNGFLCRVKDSNDLANNMELLADSPELINQFGRNSRSLFLSNYDETMVIEKQLNIFRKLAKEGEMCTKIT